ncbi:MAG: hypothetical protein HQK83_16095 [Fibrobacteria bacterium]|nr:hypothetical protein [Fibrobacteria bacterium]
MIDAQKRQAVLTLYQAGKRKKHIARWLEIDIKTVRLIIRAGKDDVLPKIREDIIDVDEELLRKVFHACNGYRQRIYEILTEEHGLDIGYSTLTR